LFLNMRNDTCVEELACPIEENVAT